MKLRRIRDTASTALGRHTSGPGTPPSADPSSATDVAALREELRRTQQKVLRLRKRLAALEEQVDETRRLGRQVGQLGDLVTQLLARRAAGSDPGFSKDLSDYADDL